MKSWNTMETQPAFIYGVKKEQMQGMLDIFQ